MSAPTEVRTTRRDPRFALGEPVGEVALPGGGSATCVAPLMSISVAGISLRLPDDAGLDAERDRTLSPVTVRIGRCAVAGSLTVRNVIERETGCELGCLFIPGGEEEETRWMALLEGFEAALRAATRTD